jgi:hypothetical protein
MTIAHRPAKANQDKLDCRIDKEGRGLMSDRALIMAPMSDADRFIPRQSARSTSPSCTCQDVTGRSGPYHAR